MALSRLLWAVCFFVLLAACDSDSQPTTTTAPTLTLIPSTATFTPLPPSATPTPEATINPLGVLPPTATFVVPRSLPDEANRVISAAFDDAEERFDLPRDELGLLGLKIVSWRDPELTCQNTPLGFGTLAEDRNAGLPGFRLILGDESPRALVYFADLAGAVIYCEDVNLLDVGGTALYADPLGGELAELAREALARRLDVPGAAIRVVDTLNITWLDSSLGCPQEDSNPTAQRIPGYRIALDYNGASYVYHADAQGVNFCPSEREVLPRPFEATPLPTLTVTPGPTAIPGG